MKGNRGQLPKRCPVESLQPAMVAATQNIYGGEIWEHECG